MINSPTPMNVVSCVGQIARPKRLKRKTFTQENVKASTIDAQESFNCLKLFEVECSHFVLQNEKQMVSQATKLLFFWAWRYVFFNAYDRSKEEKAVAGTVSFCFSWKKAELRAFSPLSPWVLRLLRQWCRKSTKIEKVCWKIYDNPCALTFARRWKLVFTSSEYPTQETFRQILSRPASLVLWQILYPEMDQTIDEHERGSKGAASLDQDVRVGDPTEMPRIAASSPKVPQRRSGTWTSQMRMEVPLL